MKPKPKIEKIALSVFTVLAVALILSLSVSYLLFYNPKPAELPCRNCTGDAESVHVNGFDLYYRAVGERGQNPPVVLLHGGPGMSSQTFKNSFDFLADTYQVVYYDQRGSGNSQIIPDNSLYTIQQLVDELETLRRDVLESETMILVGHSAGGALAQRYALQYPEHVEKMVLVTALPANGGMAISGVLMDAFFALINVASGNIPPADPLMADMQLAQLSDQANLARLYDPNQSDLIQDFGYQSFAVNRELTRSTFGGNFDEELQQLMMDVLILYGAGDKSDFTGEAAATQMHAQYAHSTLVGFEQSGHWPYLEEPERFQQVLRSFLSE